MKRQAKGPNIKAIKKHLTKNYNDVVLRAAFRIAKELNANALFVSGECVEDLSELNEKIKGLKILFITRDGERIPDRLRDLKSHIIRVPPVALTRMGQIKIAVLFALSKGMLSMGDTIICLSGLPESGSLDSILILEVGKEFEMMTSLETTSFSEDVRPEVFESILSLALELAHEGREGKPVGTIFTIGDHERVLQFSRQMVFNPFEGHPEEKLNIFNPGMRETIKEFSAIDGAFVIRGDGVVVAAGRHLNAAYDSVQELPQGLGTRHLAAAGITSVTDSIAIAISESTGNVAIFKKGGIFTVIEKRTPKVHEETYPAEGGT